MSLGTVILEASNQILNNNFNYRPLLSKLTDLPRSVIEDFSEIAKYNPNQLFANAAVISTSAAIATYSLVKAAQSESKLNKAIFSLVAITSGAIAAYEIFSTTVELNKERRNMLDRRNEALCNLLRRDYEFRWC